MYWTSSNERNRTRRFAVAGFAILYAFLIFSATAERATEAVDDALAHGSSHPDASSEKLKRPETRLTQTKLNEPGFVVEFSREAVAAPISSERHTPVSTVEFRSVWTDSVFSSRAPPSL
jgi:hypothetical protein